MPQIRRNHFKRWNPDTVGGTKPTGPQKLNWFEALKADPSFKHTRFIEDRLRDDLFKWQRDFARKQRQAEKRLNSDEKDAEQDAEIIGMHKAGKNPGKIANKLGLEIGKVVRTLKRHGR